MRLVPLPTTYHVCNQGCGDGASVNVGLHCRGNLLGSQVDVMRGCQGRRHEPLLEPLQVLLAISGAQIRKEHRAAASCNRPVSVSLRAKVFGSSSWFLVQSRVLCILHHQDSTIPHLIGIDLATRSAANTALRLHDLLGVFSIGTQPGRPQLSRTQRPEKSVIFSHVPGPFFAMQCHLLLPAAAVRCCLRMVSAPESAGMSIAHFFGNAPRPMGNTISRLNLFNDSSLAP